MNPPRASSIAGWIASRRANVPYRSRASESPATMPCGAGAVFFVTTRRDSIMEFSRRETASGTDRVLRDVDDRPVFHVDPPARGVRPHLGWLALLHRRPVLPGELLHLRGIGNPGERRAEQDHDLLVGLTDRDLLDEPEGRHVDGVGGVGILAQILAD